MEINCELRSWIVPTVGGRGGGALYSGRIHQSRCTSENPIKISTASNEHQTSKSFSVPLAGPALLRKSLRTEAQLKRFMNHPVFMRDNCEEKIVFSTPDKATVQFWIFLISTFVIGLAHDSAWVFLEIYGFGWAIMVIWNFLYKVDKLCFSVACDVFL